MQRNKNESVVLTLANLKINVFSAKSTLLRYLWKTEYEA